MRLLAVTITTMLILAANAPAASANCCGDRPCCSEAACCTHQPAAAVPQEPEQAPVREYAKVTFESPVRIADRVLMGTYLIEHDTARMARGEPCTHIYKIDDRRLPVVAFHCVHVERARNDGPTATITVLREPDLTTRMFRLVEFQFAGSTAGHGVPDER